MASAKANRVIVVDLEATCWEERNSHISEIIEIGICIVDLKQCKVVNPKSFVVKPVNLDISPYCTQLTGWTKEAIQEQGRPLLEVLNTMKKEYPIASCGWGSWGDYDRIMLMNECQVKGIEYPFSKTHLNLKYVHAMMTGQSKGVGMAEALKQYNMELVGRHHSGVDDSVNIGQILLRMVRPNGHIEQSRVCE